MKNFSIKEITMSRIPQEKIEKEFPSYVIGYN
jgi:hypothetical protein